MSMKACRLTGAVAALLAGFGLAGAACADERVYIGGSVGHGMFSHLEDAADACEDSGVCSAEDDALTYSVYGGFRFSPHFSVEAGWVGHETLESVRYGTFSCSPPNGRSVTNPRTEDSSWSVYGAAVGRLPMAAPLERITPFVKAGVYYWKRKLDFRGGPCGDFAAVREEDFAPLAGAGIDVALTGRTSLRLEWTWFTEGDGVHAFLGGLNFRF